MLIRHPTAPSRRDASAEPPEPPGPPSPPPPGVHPSLEARRASPPDAIEAWRESERRFRDLAENIEEVFWLVDAGGRLIYVSPAYERVWGRPCAERYDDPLKYIDYVHPDDQPALRRHAAANYADFDTQYRVIRPDGSVRWVRDRAFPVRDEHGRVVRMAGIAQDVTDRRELELGLEMQLRLVDAIQHALITTDVDGRIVAWNRHAEAVYGYSMEEALGQNVIALLSPGELSLDTREAIRALLAGQPISRERPVRRKDGETIWVSVSASPIRSADGAVAMFVGASHDVTERRRLEQQFRQAQKMEAVGRLAGGVAHDFNNLLTVIKAHAEFLGAAVDPDGEARADVEEISKAAHRAAALTRQLLAFSRQQVLEKRPVDLNSVLSELERMLSRLIGEDIELGVTLSPELPLVMADLGQVEQAVVNLVVNARDAMPDGGRLELRTRTVVVGPHNAGQYGGADAGKYAVVSVSDSGIGMSAEVRARIFEPFFTTKPTGKGTGLGLATVYGIVSQSGGFIDVESAEGVGSTFAIYLPTCDAGEIGAGPERSASGARGNGETVLVVEDQPEVLAVTRRILTARGYHVLEAKNGLAALGLLKTRGEEVDLLITDAVMPLMNGAELVRAIHARFPDLPVVVASGYIDDAVVWRGRADAGAVFLQKPFRANHLLNAVREALSGRRQPRTTTSA